jgi:hypothetical protein
MFCPQCGTSQSDEMKFCKSCGANLFAVRQVVSMRDTGEKFDWSKTWVAEMFLSDGERKRRKEELELQRGITPEVKRLREIKAGVITASVGVSIAIFLYIFMDGIIRGGRIGQDATEILSRLWVVGVIPFFVGVGLLINGLFVNARPRVPANRAVLEEGSEPPPALGAANTSEFLPSPISVTEGTTKLQVRDRDE